MKKSIVTMITCLVVLSFQVINAQSWTKGSIKGEGEVTKKTIDVSSFSGVSSGLSANIIVKQGNARKVVVEAQSNIIDNMEFNVKDGTLHLKNKKNVRNTKQITIYITTPELHVARLAGSGNFTTDGHFSNVGDIDITLSGSGNMDLDIDAKKVKSVISGSGNLDVKGTGSSNDVRISGSGNINASNLKVSECTASISGSGDCKVNVSTQLDARISGSGNVRYSGSPKVNAKVSGSGRVNAM